MFYTDHYIVYKGVIPPAQHRAISKLARMTNHVERFNCTHGNGSRGWCVPRYRSPRSCNQSEPSNNFICDYNLTRCAALPG